MKKLVALILVMISLMSCVEIFSLLFDLGKLDRNYYFRDLNLYVRVAHHHTATDSAAMVYFSRDTTFGTDYIVFDEYVMHAKAFLLILPPNKIEVFTRDKIRSIQSNNFDIKVYQDSIFPYYYYDDKIYDNLIQYPFYCMDIGGTDVFCRKCTGFRQDTVINLNEDFFHLPEKKTWMILPYKKNKCIYHHSTLYPNGLFVEMQRTGNHARVLFYEDEDGKKDYVDFNYVDSFRNIDAYLFPDKQIKIVTLGGIKEIHSTNFKISELKYSYSNSLYCPMASASYALPKYDAPIDTGDDCKRLIFNHSFDGFIVWDMKADTFMFQARKDMNLFKDEI